LSTTLESDHFTIIPDASFSSSDHNIEAFKNGWRKRKVYRRESWLQGRCGENSEVPQRKGWLAGGCYGFSLFISSVVATVFAYTLRLRRVEAMA
jgi:hypothetical protein